jgi:hypothetical protein
MPNAAALDTVVTPPPPPAPAAAMLTLDSLQHTPMLISSGPTGRSYYWPEQFATLHPYFATTDVAFNHIDVAWMGRGVISVRVILSDEKVGAAAADPLAHTLQELRVRTGLPAADVAAMVGVKRRQFYNLLASGRAGVDRQRWIHELASGIERLNSAASDDPARVRAAILKPLADGTTFFDRASTQDEGAVRGAVDELVAMLLDGRVSGRVRTPSPALRRRGGSAGDFLSGYRDRDA